MPYTTSGLHLYLCFSGVLRVLIYFQDKITELKELHERVAGFRSRGKMQSMLASAAKCVTPPSGATADYFCKFIYKVADYTRTHGFDSVLSIDAVPIILSFLRRWPTDKAIVFWSCKSLFWLASKGGNKAKASITSVPDHASLLRVACDSGLEKWPDSTSIAADVLQRLRDMTDEQGPPSVANIARSHSTA